MSPFKGVYISLLLGLVLPWAAVDQKGVTPVLYYRKWPWGTYVCMELMDLEKAYDMADRDALWKLLQIYDVRGKLF